MGVLEDDNEFGNVRVGLQLAGSWWGSVYVPGGVRAWRVDEIMMEDGNFQRGSEI